MQMAVSLVTWSARARRRGIVPNGTPRKSRSSPVTTTCLPISGKTLDHVGEALVEELRLLDGHDVRIGDGRLDLVRVVHGHGMVLRTGARDDGHAIGAGVEARLHEQHLSPGDREAAQQAQHLVGLAAEHAAGDDVDPAVGIEHR